MGGFQVPPTANAFILTRARSSSEGADVRISGEIRRAGDHAGGKNAQNTQINRVETTGLWMQITAQRDSRQSDLQSSWHWWCWRNNNPS